MKGKKIRYMIVVLFSILSFQSVLFSESSGSDDNMIFNEYQMQPEVFHPVSPGFGSVNSKGDLNIQVPIMTVPGRNGLNFDIKFSYSSGVTVFQSATWIGLGWSFDPGSITRDVVGNIKNIDKVYGIDFPGREEEYAHDKYYLHINGSTIPYYKTNEGIHKNLTPSNEFVPNEFNHYKIEASEFREEVSVDGEYTSHPDYHKFKVIKDDGTQYIYGKPTLAYYSQMNSEFRYENNPICYVSTWRLIAILASDYRGPAEPDDYSTGGWIKFSYKYDETKEILTYKDNEYFKNETLYQLAYLHTIETPTHKAVFTTSIKSDKNLELSKPTNGTYSITRKLDQIKLYNKLNSGLTNVKTINLKYNQEGANIEFTKLYNIQITGTDNSEIQEYKFQYYMHDKSITHALSQSLLYYDDFGYYNKSTTPVGNIGDTTNAIVYSLKEITFPSGGKEEYIYQVDRFTNSPTYCFFEYYTSNTNIESFASETKNKYQGGLRVKKIIRTASVDDI